MKRYLLPDGCNFYRANLHAHSKISDGSYTPAELKELYKSHGYSILAITDHFKLENHSQLSGDDFLMLSGCEIAILEPGDFDTKYKKVCHLNLYPARPDTVLFDFDTEYSAEGINRIIEKANENGFLVVYNHPAWSAEEQYLDYNGLFGLEIFNASTAAMGHDEHNGKILDEFLRQGKKLFCLANDDCHNALPDDHPYSDMFSGFTMIAAPSLDYPSVMNALKNGNFYASEGPEIYELSEENGTVYIKTSPVKEVTLITGTRRRARTAVSKKSGEYITETQFPLDKTDRYFRIEAKCKYGNKAYTQFYSID